MSVAVLSSVAETRALGARLAHEAVPGSCFALCGALGSGKTELVRGFVEALSAGETVRSPSFSLVHSYAAPHFPVHHFDFYRLTDAEELYEIGFHDYISNPAAVCLIEWADIFPDVLPAHTVWVRFTDGESASVRIVTIG